MDSLEKSDSVRIRKESLLLKYGYTETMCLLKCAEYDLLSPMYFSGVHRGGCWFCPNQGIGEFCRLRGDNPELWGELLELDKTEGLASRFFKYDKTLDDVSKMVDAYEEKYAKFLHI